MRTAGDYALMHANGMKWADVVAEIRREATEPIGIITKVLTKETRNEAQGASNIRRCCNDQPCMGHDLTSG